MKSIIINEKFGKLEYKENFWTGRKEITINGTKLTKVAKNLYAYKTEEGTINLSLKGSFLSGVTAEIGNQKIDFVDKTKWYEWVLAFLSVIFVIVWGNNVELCEIFPVVGGAIGGAISGLISGIGLLFMKASRNIMFKLLIAVCTFIVAVFICYLVAILIILLL